MLNVEVRSIIPIDYTLATETVYANAAVAIIANDWPLDLPCDIRIRDDSDWDKRPAIMQKDTEPMSLLEHWKRRHL